MRLFDTIQDLDNLDAYGVICARLPWHPDAECSVVRANEDLGIPAETKSAGLQYFLEVNVAREVLEVFDQRTPTPEEKFQLLVYYAENDGFPEWVYEADA
jgi:hypothetical protein